VLLKAIETVQAGGTPPGRPTPPGRAMTGPDTVDGVAPGGHLAHLVARQAQAKRDRAWGCARQPPRWPPNAPPHEPCPRAAGMHDDARAAALQRAALLASGLELVRFAWCDLHGVTRGKTLVAGGCGQGACTTAWAWSAR
jgi:hypothetical protein